MPSLKNFVYPRGDVHDSVHERSVEIKYRYACS
jgi:hypothetical protein